MYNPNRFPSGYDELKTFYPVFYFDVFEMNELLKTYGQLADTIETNIDTVINNQFIERADEPTITRLEAFLWITTDRTKALDERRRLVLSFFVGFGKISASKIRQIIETFTDGAHTEITFMPQDEAGNNYLTIIVDRGDTARLLFGDIDLILSRKLPAHIAYELALRYSFSAGIRARSTKYLFNYELCGTKPETATKGDINLISGITSQKRTNTLFKYKSSRDNGEEVTGVYPYTTTLGDINNTSTGVSESNTETLFNFKSADDQSNEIGQYPNIITLGDFNLSELGVSESDANMLFAYKLAEGTLLDRNESAVGVSESDTKTFFGYKSSAEENSEPGVYPNVIMRGDYNRADAGATVNSPVSDYSVDYKFCGTMFVGD